MQKDFPIYTLIHSLSTAEKSYFKKYAFKRVSKNNDDYKRIFDLIDKQETFDIAKIKADKKISTAIKKNLAVNFNHLQKKIVQSLVDFKRSSSSLSQIFENILEFEVYKEKMMIQQAEKTLKNIDKLIVNDDFFLLKPFIYFLPFDIIRASLNKNTKKRELQTKKYNNCIEEFNVLSQTRIIGLNIEKLFLKNAGILLHSKKDKQEAKELLKQTNKLLAIENNDFQMKSILSNNLFILITMVGNIADFDKLSTSFISFYKKNITHKGKATEIYDFLVILINLASVSTYFDKINIFKQCVSILKSEINNINEKPTQEKLQLEITQLKLLNYVLHKEEMIEEQLLNKYQNQLNTIDKETMHYINYINFISVILLRNKQYDALLELSAELMQREIKEGFSKSYYFIKIVRALAWLKKENLTLFHSEIQSVYKFMIKNNFQNIEIECVNYIKKLDKFPIKIDKRNSYNSIKKQFEKANKKNSISEKINSIKYLNIIEIEFEL